MTQPFPDFISRPFRNIVQGVTQSLRKVCRRVPLVRGLVLANWPSHTISSKELILTTVLSLSPIWAGSLAAFAMNDNSDKDFWTYWEILLNSIMSGELFLYCTATVATVFFLVLQEPQKRAFPDRMLLGSLSVLIIGISFMFFGIRRADAWYDQNVIFLVSFILYGLSLFLFYLAILYRNTEMPDLPSMQMKEEMEFTTLFRSRRPEPQE